MASIVGWKRGNQTYYYLVESARVNGNRPDVTQFATVLDELTSRYGAILDTHSDGDPQDKDKDKAPLGPTVVFDAGQNSAANLAHLSLIHISEPTRLGMISYAVFCLKKKK